MHAVAFLDERTGAADHTGIWRNSVHHHLSVTEQGHFDGQDYKGSRLHN